jgi:molybdate transport system substrate-binding protein
VSDIAVRAGTPKPDVSTPEALKAALLAAPSLGYADPARGGQGGTHFAKVIEQLGLDGDPAVQNAAVP